MRSPLAVWLLVPLAVLLFAGRTFTSVYVAFSSQPECVDHLKARNPERAGSGPQNPIAKTSRPSRGKQISDVDKPYGLLSELSGIEETTESRPPAPLAGGSGIRLARGRLARPHHQARAQPGLWTSDFVVSVVFIWMMFALGWDYILFQPSRAS